MLRKILAFMALLAVLGTGCAQKPAATTSEKIGQKDKLLVYATIYPLYDFAKKIGGDKVEVVQIMPPGADPHHFEPSAKTLAQLSRAALLIYNGASMEPWMEKIKQALAGSQVVMVDTSSKVELITLKDDHAGQDDEEKHAEEIHPEDSEPGHRHDIDPHVWLSPRNAKIQGQEILDALLQADPDNGEYYRKNYAQFAQKLDELHAQFAAALSQTPRKEIVVAHDALGYLAREYGLVQIPIRGLTAEAEPSPAKVKEIIELAKTKKISHIFFETTVDPKVSEVIAAEIGAGTLQLYTLDNITQEQAAQGEDYFSLMQKNLENLQTALKN